MTTYHTEAKPNNMQLEQAVQLIAVSKKYPPAKTTNKDITSSFEHFWALRDISLAAYQGEVLGIIGRNGAGKTTLLNIIARILAPTQGEVLVKGRVLGLFNLGVGFQDELTGRENIFLNGAIIGATKEELANKLSSIIGFSELGDFIDMPLGTYSQGMRLRLAFSIIANLDFDILVIDEVLAVGDALFQSKCFQRLMDFRRDDKILIITTQGMDLIERLCDRVVLLDHGRLLFYGNPQEGINRYRSLLNTEKFFVGPTQKETQLFTDTKKWAEDVSGWGQKLGTKEAVIDSVEFINKFGFRCKSVKSGDSLKIKVNFTVRNVIKEPHFGVAIFRNDGVYCYGPNTEFDGYKTPELKAGKGWFMLEYKKVLLAPGEYRISVAIWDKNETLAFDYHDGCYSLIIKGENPDNALLNMPFKLRYPKKDISHPVRLFNHRSEEKNTLMTNEFARLEIDSSQIQTQGAKNLYLWLGIYRDDGVLCQKIISAPKKSIEVIFPRLALLPGGYNISVGVRDSEEQKLISSKDGAYPFKTVFGQKDHGTIYLEHSWKLPK